MKTAKTKTLLRRVSEKCAVSSGIDRFIHEDVTSNCAWDSFYVQAAGAKRPINRTESAHMVRNTDAADFSYIYDFMYIYSGKGTIECDGQKIPVKENTVYIINRLHPHEYYPDPDDPFSSYWINCAGTLMDDIFAMLGITEGVLQAEGEEFLDDFEYMNNILLRMKLGDGMQKGYERLASVLFGILLAATEYKRKNNHITALEREEVYNEKIEVIEWAKDYTDRNIALDITVQRLADKANYSGSQISKLFVKKYGVTLTKYILEQKLGFAKEILETSDAPIETIAEALNFSNVAHFSNLFSKHVGISPTAYRKKYSRIRPTRDNDNTLF